MTVLAVFIVLAVLAVLTVLAVLAVLAGTVPPFVGHAFGERSVSDTVRVQNVYRVLVTQ